MKKVFAITLALMLALSGNAFASIQLYQDGAEQGHVNQFNCSTGTTCTKVGDRVNVVTAVGTAADIRSGTIRSHHSSFKRGGGCVEYLEGHCERNRV